MAKPLWTPWHEVVKLREDLRSGELSLAMFAADLYEVLMQSGKRPVYERPQEFFALTFPTYNLRQLVRDVALRLAGKNDKAVRQLELTYGGGKTHTLITLYHLVNDPANLPKLPAVGEFTEAIGQLPPKACVVGLCFDKLDVEKGMEVRGPDGKTRTLKYPWSVLAYQIAGDDGLRLLHAKNKPEERESAPAENLLTQLLEIPVKQGLGMLILIDEVLMYAREKVRQSPEWRGALIAFFQYLTQAATKVDRCCIVASLLATDTSKYDKTGQGLQADLYDIFQRQREEAVEPVVKEDVAEVLRRRFFTPDSLEKARPMFPQHVQAALKGIGAVDEQTARQGPDAEKRFERSYPFHPDLTDAFYSKWTQLAHFHRTRGVLRTFALALRAAEKWDLSPLVGPAVFLNAEGKDGLSEAVRELVTVANTQEEDGRRQEWSGILGGELSRAQDIQRDSSGLKFREVEQAVLTTFLHSQPIGQTAKTRDLVVLLGCTRPDKIELEKGLTRWAQISHWLDDQYTGSASGQLPGEWRLGNRPNLVQMHAVAMGRVSDDIVRARLLDEIGKVKDLTSGASAAGVRVHSLPVRPKDIEDDGRFHYAVMGLSAASDSGKPSPEARRFIDETTGPDKPRVFRNAVLLLTPSHDGMEVALARVKDYLAWEDVNRELSKPDEAGSKKSLDLARMQTLALNIDKAKRRIPDAVRQAYCTVVTVSEKNDVHAFKINVTDESHFTIIKNDPRSRVQDTAVTAEALLPGGPYDLWKKGDKSRRVKDLSGAFAQMPHLPKMLQARAIVDTLVEGCGKGAFILKLTRPDGSFRTWWYVRPDESALEDPALELVLPEAAELAEVPPERLERGKLQGLWDKDEIAVQKVMDYFKGGTVIQVDRGGYTESVTIPKASDDVVRKSVAAAVEQGKVWLLAPPASILGEPIPAGVLTPAATLCVPPPMIAAAEILPENLPTAWEKETCTGLSVATALSQKFGKPLPWKTVRDAIDASLRARFAELTKDSGQWPCDYPTAQTIKLRVSTGAGAGGGAGGGGKPTKRKVAEADLEPSEIQDLGDIMPKLLDVKAKANIPVRFHMRIEVGDGETPPTDSVTTELNTLLKDIKDELRLE